MVRSGAVAEPAGTMPAAVYRGNRTVVVEEVTRPEPGPGEVLLRVSHCGICGTDLHMMMEDWGTPGSVGGHEYSGVVESVGPAVDGWAPGDRVVGGPGSGCGECRQCRAGRSNLCLRRNHLGVLPTRGAFASHKAVDAGALFRVPDHLDLRTAALTEPVAVALRGVRRSGAGPGSRVLVTGAGPIGALTVAVLRARGVSDITVSEPAPLRRELAKRAGAAAVVHPEELEVPALPMDLVAAPYQVAFECSGRPEAMESALASLDRAGLLVLSGTGMRRPQFDPNRIIINELSITGTIEYTKEDYDLSLELLSSGGLPVSELVDPVDVPLAGVQRAMEELSSGDRAGKVLVVPDA